MKPYRVTLQANSQIRRVLVWARTEITAIIKAQRENRGLLAARVEVVN